MNPSYFAIGQLYEMQARRRLAEDWDHGHPLPPVRSSRMIAILRAIGAQLVRHIEVIRAVGAYGPPS